MGTNRIRIVFMMLVALSAVAVFGLTPASAALQVTTGTVTVTPVTATKTVAAAPITATATLTAPTATKTAPNATATKPAAVTATITPTKVVTSVVATATITPTKVVTSVVATATLTSTKSITPTVTRTATRTVTATPTVVQRAPRAVSVTSLSTAFALQNTDSSTTATINATFYNVTGTAVSTVTTSANPNRSVLVDQRSAGGGLDLFSTFQGSVVVSSTTQLAAVVNEYGGTSSSGTDFRMDSYTGTSSTAASTSILLPQVVKDFGAVKWNSVIAIQNTSASANANVTITYTNILSSPAGTVVHNNIVIPPGASAMIDMASEAPGLSSLFGPANITSNQSVAVVVNRNAAGALVTYGGLTSSDSGQTLIVTQALTNFNQTFTWGTAIEGMTVSGGDSSYSITYTNLLNSVQKTCSLSSGPTFRIDFRSQFWPAGCTPPVDGNNSFFGQVSITGSTPLVALVNQIAGNTANGTRTTTIPAFSSTGGSGTGFAPLMMNNYLDSGTGISWGTAIEGRMAGTGTVQIDYYTSTGSHYSATYNVQSDNIFRFDQRNGKGTVLPDSTLAAAKITAPYPILFKVNVTAMSDSVQGDPYGSYKGITQ
jgi:hypothetical protein